jgi:hypothetical protein
MFWNQGKNTVVEANNKFKFLATFNTFKKNTDKNINNLNNSNVLDYEPTKVHFAVKKIDAPKMNLDFERAYANEYIHYFQNGSIHWEPITISFIDATSLAEDISSMRYLFNNYIVGLKNSGVTIESHPITDDFEKNRTGLIDLPILCNNITISSITAFATQTYPTTKDLNVKQDLQANNNTGSIEQILSDGDNLIQVESTFTIKNPRITKIDFGSFDYNSDDINEISITVIPEWCSFSEQQP